MDGQQTGERRCANGHAAVPGDLFCRTCGGALDAPAGRAPGPRADWYPDPSGRYRLRYWDGRAWTSDVSSNGERSTDLLSGGEAERSAPPRAMAPPQPPPHNSWTSADLRRGATLLSDWIRGQRRLPP